MDILCELLTSKMELIPALADQIKVLRNNQDTLLRELLETKCDLSKAYDTIEDLKDTIARESFEKDREGKNVVIWNLSIKELAKHRSRASTDRESVGSFAGLLVRRVLPDIGKENYTVKRLPQTDNNGNWRMLISFRTTADAQNFVLRCPQKTGIRTLKLGLTSLQRRLVTKTKNVIRSLPNKSDLKPVQYQQYKIAHVLENDTRKIITVDDVSKFIERPKIRHNITLEDLLPTQVPTEIPEGSPCTTNQASLVNFTNDEERNTNNLGDPLQTFLQAPLDTNTGDPTTNCSTVRNKLSIGHLKQKKLDDYFAKPKSLTTNPKRLSSSPLQTPSTNETELRGATVFQNGKIIGAYDCSGCFPDLLMSGIFGETTYKHTCGWVPEVSSEESPQSP